MSNGENWRGKRMRAAMDARGLTSGQVALRMGVTGGAVRGWTAGRRGVGLEELMTFAAIVGYPLEYFLREECGLPKDHELRQEVAELTSRVEKLSHKLQPTRDDIFAFLRAEEGLSEEEIQAIAQIIERHNNEHRQQ